MDSCDRVTAILQFWFGPDEGAEAVSEAILQRWFGGGDEVDAACRELFGEDVKRALAGELDAWRENARARLALVILLDQFTRNLNRASPRAFDGDAAALHLTLEGIERGLDRELAPYPRMFFYMPLQHSEDLEVQWHSINCFGELALEVPAELRERFYGTHDYAIRHRDVIERFGRFPHRNQVLGRDSTAEELAFLQGPGSSFA